MSVDAPAGKPTFTNKKKESQDKQKNDMFGGFGGTSTKKPAQKQNRNERELTKTNWVDSAALQVSLNDLDEEKYDQFANKKSTYSES